MSFIFKKLNIPEIILIDSKSFSDNRGYFMESFKESDFRNIVEFSHFNQSNEMSNSTF
jgi:dTDP-4-dehydrorhamnose 3,5-epimerase